MDRATIRSLTTVVPTIQRRVNILGLESATGGQHRVNFLLLTLLPFAWAFDQNGGIFTLGFSRGTQMERHFKMRPDYATGTVFAAERQEMPTFKSMQ
jgi:hypothetical protein